MMAVVAALLLGTVALAAGCGADTAQAQQYMKKGDDLMSQVEQLANQFQTKVQQGLGDITNPSTIQQIKDMANAIDTKAQEARAAYARIGTLKGVGDYVQYADLQTRMIADLSKSVGAMNAFLDKATAAMSPADLQAASEAYQKDLQDLNQEMTDLEQQASKLKDYKNL